MLTFLPQQQEAFDYAKDRDEVALFMEMRTGKTLPIIRWAKRTSGPHLVIAPLSAIHDWEVQLLNEKCSVACLTGPTPQKEETFVKSWVDWYIINPEGVRAWPDILDNDWKTVICDESSSYMRNPKARITKLLRRNTQNIARRAVMTGTPAPEGAEDFVEQMIFVFGEFMGCTSYWQWRERWCEPGAFAWQPKVNVIKKARKEVRHKAFVKTAKQCGLFMPKVFETRYITPMTHIKAMYKRVVKDMELGQATTKWTIVSQLWLSMLSGGIVPKDYDPYKKAKFSPHKVNELLSLINGELKGQQLVVWCRFRREMRNICSALSDAGISNARIRGDTGASLRTNRVKRFKDQRVQVLVIQPRTMRMGVDLSCASVMVFYSNEWSCDTREQAINRMSHPKKKEATLVLDLVTEGTVDEALVDVLKEKSTSQRYFMERVKQSAKKKGLV